MLTSQEILQRSFKRSLRGFDPEEVNAFLRAIAQEWESQLSSYRSQREELARLQAAYDTLKELENTLHRTLLQAEQTSRDMVAHAKEKADLVVKEAEARAQASVHKAQMERAALVQEIDSLSRKREHLTIQIRSFLNAALEQMESFEKLYPSSGGPFVAENAQATQPQPVNKLSVPPEAPWQIGNMAGDEALIDQITREL